MASRSNRKVIARETVEILKKGFYPGPGGELALEPALQAAVEGTEVITPERKLSQGESENPQETVFDVTTETTFAAARRLAQEGRRPCALNFASAKNPGGGFLNGSQAQEEALARASGLYPCLMEADEYYTVNRACRSCLYTEYMIYSPLVPIFRDDEDELLPEPSLCSIITAPAVNAGAVRRNEADTVDQIGPAMRRRIARVLGLAHEKREAHLVLGAWGCGVFQNEPEEMAAWFAEGLRAPGNFASSFRSVVFAVPDFSENERFIAPFRKHFA